MALHYRLSRSSPLRRLRSLHLWVSYTPRPPEAANHTVPDSTQLPMLCLFSYSLALQFLLHKNWSKWKVMRVASKESRSLCKNEKIFPSSIYTYSMKALWEWSSKTRSWASWAPHKICEDIASTSTSKGWVLVDSCTDTYDTYTTRVWWIKVTEWSMPSSSTIWRCFGITNKYFSSVTKSCMLQLTQLRLGRLLCARVGIRLLCLLHLKFLQRFGDRSDRSCSMQLPLMQSCAQKIGCRHSLHREPEPMNQWSLSSLNLKNLSFAPKVQQVPQSTNLFSPRSIQFQIQHPEAAKQSHGFGVVYYVSFKWLLCSPNLCQLSSLSDSKHSPQALAAFGPCHLISLPEKLQAS